MLFFQVLQICMFHKALSSVYIYSKNRTNGLQSNYKNSKWSIEQIPGLPTRVNVYTITFPCYLCSIFLAFSSLSD